MKGLLRGVVLLVGLVSTGAWAESSVLIWPINPQIAAGEKAAALWLENRGSQPVNLQIRVLAWSQNGHEDHLEAQRQVVGSPPMATIAPGKQQMIRLIAMQPAAPASEQTYRVLVDEMLGANTPADEQLGVKFQMRYSVPLFVFGAGAGLDKGEEAPAGLQLLSPQLAYQVAVVDGRRYLSLRNTGNAHARLSKVRMQQGGKSLSLADGLLGYVLPGATMRWVLPESAPGSGFILDALINERREPLVIPAH